MAIAVNRKMERKHLPSCKAWKKALLKTQRSYWLSTGDLVRKISRIYFTVPWLE